MLNCRSLLTLLVVWAGVGALGDDLGDKAPPLKIAKWVKGQPVDLANAKNKIHVIEFWSTRCPVCRATIPLMTRLQKKYADKGGVFVGVTDEQEDSARVERFVEKMGDKMGYVVAIDDGQQTIEAYMGGFKVDAVPHAFVVDQQGIVIWHGHPAYELDEKLASIVAGTYSIRTYLDVKRANEFLVQYLTVVRAGGRGVDVKTEAVRIGNLIYKLGSTDPETMNKLAWPILDDATIRFRDLELAMKASKAAYDGCDGKDAVIVDTYARAFYETGDVETALKYQKAAVSLVGNNQRLRRDLTAWLRKYEKEVGRR